MVGPAARLPLRRSAVPLDGRRVHLRPAEPADAPAFTTILSDPTVHPWWQAADPAADARQLADRADHVAVWAIEEAGVIVGVIQAHEETDPRYRHAGIDIVLAGSAQDRGLGSDAVRTVARWLIDVRRHHRLTIDPAAANERAIRAYRRVGFRPVGIMRRYEGDLDGTWHDGLLMDLLADDLDDRPTPTDASDDDLIGSVTLAADEDEAYLGTGAAWRV
ncbi:MAG TPA: GNAT family protein, partial [Candidatus Limnocylindrales bacterium]|nr:GNAT family protein [Candidatus Limnocylindrales bacterium]